MVLPAKQWHKPEKVKVYGELQAECLVLLEVKVEGAQFWMPYLPSERVQLFCQQESHHRI